MQVYVYLALALTLLGGGGFAVWKYTDAITRAETAENNAAGWKASQEYWQTEQERTQRDFDEADEIARQRGQALAAASGQLSQLRGAFADLAKRDTGAAAWLSAPVDPSVRRLRRTSAGCPEDLSVPCPAPVASADREPAYAGRSKPGPAAGDAGAAKRPGTVQ